jgi:hypothetical protein
MIQFILIVIGLVTPHEPGGRATLRAVLTSSGS